MKTTVAIVRCKDYTPSEVRAAVREAVDLLGGMGRFVPPGSRVLMKPNLLASWEPDAAVCTHPTILQSLLELAASSGGECSVGDSPAVGGDTPGALNRLLKKTGVQDVLADTDAAMEFFAAPGTEVDIEGAAVFHRIPIASAVCRADVVINIPKFKTHALMRLTGAVKNLFGCIPGRRKVGFHLQAGDNPSMFAQMLLDVLMAVRPALSVMDGVWGMDGEGPSAGRKRQFGVILASEDPVALDAVACAVAGIDPMEIPVLRLARERGIGETDLKEIEILGVSPEEVRIPDFRLPARGDLVSRIPAPVYRALRNQLVRSPALKARRCTRCNACVRICPVHAVSRIKGRLRFDYSRCIRCYCCQEVCPEHAIYTRPGMIKIAVEAVQAVAKWTSDLLKREAGYPG